MSDTSATPPPRFDAPAVRPLALLAASAAVNASFFSAFEMAAFFAPRPPTPSPVVVATIVEAPPPELAAPEWTAAPAARIFEVPSPPPLAVARAATPPVRRLPRTPAPASDGERPSGMIAANLCRAESTEATGCVRVDDAFRDMPQAATIMNASLPAIPVFKGASDFH